MCDKTSKGLEDECQMKGGEFQESKIDSMTLIHWPNKLKIGFSKRTNFNKGIDLARDPHDYVLVASTFDLATSHCQQTIEKHCTFFEWTGTIANYFFNQCRSKFGNENTIIGHTRKKIK
jgi:hypothetical protein